MHIIILSGGVGSRLWPVSRELHPKPFMKMRDGQSFLQKAYLRSIKIPSIKSITTVTSNELLLKTKEEYKKSCDDLNKRIDVNYIVEPFGRNTAAAIALAAKEVSDLYGEDAIMLVLPSDHIIQNETSFLEAVKEAEALAKRGEIVTFGIKPNSPEIGYGYIEANGNKVLRFIEKPSLEQAKTYLASNNFLWNSGMFCFSCESILCEMALHCPDILSATIDCLKKSKIIKGSSSRNNYIDSLTFANVPENSIDYAIMEKTNKAAVVPCDFGWSDIGTWSAFSELMDSDSNGNNINGDVIIHNVSNCYIESPDRVIGAVGVENLIIVDTSDALLIADKRSSQDVKNIFNQLKDIGNEAHKLHKTVQRPWGTFTIVEEGPGFKIKRIEVNPEASLSLQMHNHRAEHWVIIGGTAKIINGEDEFILEANQSTYVPIGNKHRLTNPGTEKLILIEIQTGSYLGEDDIIRFDDIYGRIVHAA